MSAQEPGTILAKTARGVGWTVGWRMATRLLGLVNTLVLVRLLAPADFGLVALGYSFITAVDSLSSIGIAEALIREKSPSRELYDTGFTLNLLRSLASAAIIVAAAAPAARFFGDPRLANVLLALAAATLGDSLVNIGTVEFRRNLAFEKEFQLMIVPRIGGIVVTITIALISRSYWALIAGILSGHLLSVAFSYIIHPYRPRFSLRGWRTLADYSFWTWMISFPNMLLGRGANFVIGRLLGSTAVGIYEIGAEIAWLPVTELILPLSRATFSGFAAARHSGTDPAKTYLRIVAAMSLLTLPAGFGISLVADPLVRLAFGPQWLAAVPLLQILGVAGTVTVFGYVSTTLYSAHSLLRQMFRIKLLAAAAHILVLVLLVQRFGLIGAAIAATIAIVLESTSYVVGALRRFALRPVDLLRSIWRCLLATAAMAATLYFGGLGWHPVAGSRFELARVLVAAVGAGVVSYASVLLGLWFAAGRPAGAERDMIRVGFGLTRSLAVRLRRSNPLSPVRRARSGAG